MLNKCAFRVATWSGKTKKNEKNQVKKGAFKKSQEKNLKKHQILLVQIYQIL